MPHTPFCLLAQARVPRIGCLDLAWEIVHSCSSSRTPVKGGEGASLSLFAPAAKMCGRSDMFGLRSRLVGGSKQQCHLLKAVSGQDFPGIDHSRKSWRAVLCSDACQFCRWDQKATSNGGIRIWFSKSSETAHVGNAEMLLVGGKLQEEPIPCRHQGKLLS